MLRHLYYRTRHGSYLHNEQGIQKFAEMSMGKLIRKVTKKSATYREMNENLMVEKANLRMREEALHEKPMLDAGQFFSVRRRLWAENALIVVILLTAIFLNFLAVSALIGGGTMVLGVLRWVLAATLAMVLTGGGLIVTERLIEALMPRRTMTAEAADSVPASGRSIAILWGVLLLGIELAILGISEVRADMLGTSQDSGLLYIGFIIASMMLPLIAGTLRWDALRFVDIYKTTQTLREIESRLAQIDSILRQNGEYESNFYKIKSISYWDYINEFKTFKDNYNEKAGIVEDLSDHFARSYDAFQKEASKRYGADVRDQQAPSMRRLDTKAAGSSGNKLRQSSLQPMSAENAEQETNGNAASRNERQPRNDEGDGTYMNVQSIR